ncbi:MAG: hypothetical protein IPJ79_05240 [Bacteroidetes bacterium]|nr:hypothetical protein [Bacteroidota bacterium]
MSFSQQLIKFKTNHQWKVGDKTEVYKVGNLLRVWMEVTKHDEKDHYYVVKFENITSSKVKVQQRVSLSIPEKATNTYSVQPETRYLKASTSPDRQGQSMYT